jgi:hypothetical protein
MLGETIREAGILPYPAAFLMPAVGMSAAQTLRD